MLIRTGLIAAFLILFSFVAQAMAAEGEAKPAYAHYFDKKQYPIVTDATFPADDFILAQARFWWEIYVVIGDDEGLLHDPFNPDLVFRKVRVPAAGGRAGAKAAEAQVHALQKEIREMVAQDTSKLTPEQRELKAQFPSYWDSTAILLCAERLRFQRGLKNKFREGLERSYRYLPLIDSVFAAQNLPTRLKYLPHVESSFYPYAYSKVGAAGMWQFMKSSARRYMKVGYLVDERRDPQASTLAAARLMAYNYALLKNWPLAVVAYNHGAGGLAKAVQGTRTTDLGTIIKSYYSNSFGFASKNFYAEFLASSSIALKADSLFPKINKLEPLRTQSLVLTKACGTKLLCTVTGLSPEELEEYNLGLRPATFRGNAQLPKGFALKLPSALDISPVAMKLGLSGAVLAARRPLPVPVVASVQPAAAPVTPVAAAGVDAGPGEKAVAANGTGASAPALAANAAPAGNATVTGNAGNTGNMNVTGGSVVAATDAPSQEAVPQSAQGRIAAALPPEKPIAQDKVENPEAKEKPATVALVEKPKKGKKGVKPIEDKKADEAIRAPGAVPEVAALSRNKDTATMAKMLTKALTPPKPAAAAPVAVAKGSAGASVAGEAPAAVAHVVDSTFALQASDMDKLAHPMDRFNPAIYNLEYTYANGNLVITAGTEETVSHYADWASVSEKTLRRINSMRSGKDMRMGRKIKIPLTEEKAKEFVSKREEYYRAVEEDFYSNYYVSVTEPLRVEKGMNLWSWAQDNEIPFWLLQKHNPGKALNETHPGDTLNLPIIETGNRKWGFTRYGNSKEYLAGITRFVLTGKPEAY